MTEQPPWLRFLIGASRATALLAIGTIGGYLLAIRHGA